jgi:hypothetical protein
MSSVRGFACLCWCAWFRHGFSSATKHTLNAVLQRVEPIHRGPHNQKHVGKPPGRRAGPGRAR